MLAVTTLELARVKNIKAVKEASGNLDQALDIIHHAPSGFVLFSGEDSLNLPLMAIGAKGTISVTANVAPTAMKAFNDAALAGKWERASELHYGLLDLHRAMFFETNPVPAKTALALMGFCREEFRLPLIPATRGTREKLQALLIKTGYLQR